MKNFFRNLFKAIITIVCCTSLIVIVWTFVTFVVAIGVVLFPVWVILLAKAFYSLDSWKDCAYSAIEELEEILDHAK